MAVNTLVELIKSTLPQIFAVFIATLTAISDGMQYGWTAPVLKVLNAPDSPVKLQGRDDVWLESIYLIGGVCGLPFTILSVDRLGRRNSILAAALISLVAWILLGAANRVEYLYVARFMTGFAADMAFVSCPIYIAEIADKRIRGFLAGLIYIMLLIGILMIYSIAPFVDFYIPSIIGASIVFIQLIALPFMPYSPYYLISKGKEEEARNCLKRLRTCKDVEDELTEIMEAVKRQQSEKGTLLDLIRSKSNRKAMTIMLVLNAAQHFSSISVILMNLHEILTEGGADLSSSTSGIIFAAMMLISAVSADMVIDKFGRKALLVSSSISTGITLLCLAAYFSVKNSGVDVQGISWIPVAAVMVYAFTFKFGLGMVPIVMTAELFPANVKAKGITFADCAYVTSGVLSIELFHLLVHNFGYAVPFYVFGASCVLVAAFSYYYVPETKGKSLEEIQFMLKGEPFPNSTKPTLKLNDIECINTEHSITRF